MENKNVTSNIATFGMAVILSTSCATSENLDHDYLKKDNELVVSVFTEIETDTNLSSIISENIGKLEAKHTTLSQFNTSFKNTKKSTGNNISLASVAVDQKIILPGEIFSFNNTVGPTTKKRGYMLGRIFIKGKDSKGYGGGVCQVSSTIYNAALLAGLEIIERHPHSKPVKYVPADKDAATSYGGKDFKFKNNKSFPILINSYIQDENIYIAIETV